MPKWIGNRFGSVVPIGPGSNAGSAIYSLFDQYYASREGGWIAGTSASGGYIDAEPGGDGYTYHVFTASGALNVSGDITGAEILVVGPGGGGSQGNGSSGGGGAGGAVHVTGHTLVDGDYTILITSGGAGGPESGPSPSHGEKGSDTIMSSPVFTITSKSGGGGQSWGSNNQIPQATSNGGSGGGASGNPGDVFGTASQPGTPYTVASGTVNRYGNPGGPDGGWPASGSYRGSGGGGAGGVGSNHNSGAGPIYGGQGGNGQPFTGFVGPNPAFAPMPSDWKTAVGPTGLFAGGGAGGSESGGTPSPSPGGPGGGGNSGAGGPASANRGIPGLDNTGGGGGAGWWSPSLAASGGNGGTGIVLVRYPT